MIVVGGGVAGAAGAIALRRIGAEVTVYEAYDPPAGQVGSFLSLAANGLRALDALGCLDEVRRAGFEVARQRMWSGTGALLGDVPRGRVSADPLRSVTLMRGRLVGALRDEARRAGARVVTGERLVAAVNGTDGVHAEFAGGRTASADLLVGADGIWSATRSILDPSAPTPAYGGLYSVSGVAEGVEAEGVDIEPGVFNMVFARNGAFLYLPAPDGTVWWSAQVNSPRRPEPDGLTDAEWPARLGRLYRFEEAPRAVLRATTRLHRPTLMHALAEVPTWHDDRTVLIGDAAHPVGSGQGASMALEDTVALARELATADSIPAALAGYDRSRRTRVAKMTKADGGNRATKTTGAVGRRMQRLIMPIVIPRVYERATAWLYTHDVGALPAPAADGAPYDRAVGR
ncbi:FAD-dependent monooxygenase [Actinomadura alba]